MSTTPSPTPPARRPWWRGWADFWFRPTDPTTFGFIRISTGLLVLYIHLAYSFDLQAFFGPRGWYSVDYINKERHEVPAYVTPFWSWNDRLTFPRLSDYPHRRQAFMQFLRGLPTDKSARVEALAYLNRIDKLTNPDDFRRAIVYVQQMSTTDERKHHVTVINGGKLQDTATTEFYERAAPEFFRALPSSEKVQLAREIEAFWAALPRDTDTPTRTYVFNYFVEVPPEHR